MKRPEVILQEIKDQVALENDWIDWVCFKADCDITDIEIITDIVAKRFAIEVAKEALRNASEVVNWNFNGGHDCKQAVLSETNIPKL